MDFPHGQTITVRSTTTTRDEFGDESTVVTEVAWGPCAVAPRSSSESADPSAPAVIVGLTVYGPAITLDSDDTLWLGETDESIEGEDKRVWWHVDGIPGKWESPFTGWAPGMEVAVKRASAQ